MDKKYYSPLELIKIATQHAYCAEYLLRNNAEIEIDGHERASDTLLSFISLMHIAFELTLKAYLAHGFKTNTLHKNLIELLELSTHLDLASHDVQLLKLLSRQFAFRKGLDYELWGDRQQLQVFCTEIMKLYERVQQLMPIELHQDYL